ncbi:MAG: hypothetical protein HFF84_08840 [Oscillibacter sp.]|nr:hypothetical protein [Oscillibacter sp.]
MQISEILVFLKNEGIPYTFCGNEAENVECFSSLVHYKPGTFTWVKKQETIPGGFDLSSIVLAFVSENVEGNFQNVIRTSESKRAFFSTIEHFYVEDKEQPAIGQYTYISPKVKLGKNVRIGHNCTLDGDITIGDGTVIWNNVSILNHVTIGKNCDIHSGAVIGHDGFGYTEDISHKKTMVKHCGGVVIGDDVLISDNVCIARGTIDDTVLGDGVKIDNLCHIAHNCILEDNVALAGPCTLAGSVHIHKNGYLGAAAIRNQICIGEDAFVGYGAIVVKDVAPGQTVVGNPAKPFVRKKE